MNNTVEPTTFEIPPDEQNPRVRLLTPTNGYVWRGQTMVRKPEGTLVWEDAPAPQPGETCSAGSLDMISTSHHGYRWLQGEANFVEVPLTAWGDYSGDLYSRSNHEALLRDYPDTFVVCRFDFHGQTLLLPLDKPVDEHLLGILETLRDDYPVYDDQAHSQLEWDLSQEAWDEYLAADTVADLRDVLARHLDDDAVDEVIDTFDVDATHPASLRAMYYRLTYDEAEEYPYGETATSVVFPQHKQVVEQIASRPYALQVRITLAARFPWLVL